jgi:hypothetical protein
MHAVVYDDDGRAEGHKYYVRRLSTPSFAEKNSSIDSYRTQWRWYFRDDIVQTKLDVHIFIAEN